MPELLPPNALRLLVLAREGAEVDRPLERLNAAGITAVRADLSTLWGELDAGAAAVILPEGSYTEDAVDHLAAWLEKQPSWSDLPVLVLVPPDDAVGVETLHRLGNATFLDVPVSGRSLVSAARAAVRARERQYRHRDAIGVRLDDDADQGAERALRESEDLFRTLGEAVPDFLWMSDGEGRPIYQNPAWRKYVGMTHDELAAHGWSTIHHPDDLGVLERVWAEALRTGAPFEVEARARRHDGAYRWFMGRTVPLKNDAGDVVKWVGTMTDIHARREAEEALARADRRKDEFLAVLAHELRNPLAPLRAWLEVLQMKTAEDGTMAEPLRKMQRQTDHIVRLVDDLLDVSRISRGKIELRKERVDLGTVIRNALETTQPVLDAGRHELSVVLPAAQESLDVDPVRLTQALSNLLHNAAKFTPAGGKIDLAARREEDHVVISVRDTGRGIPQAKLGFVFDMFSQIESDDRERGGLGIGLFLAKKLVELHGGAMEARSAGRGLGSEFVLRLPLPRSREVSPAAQGRNEKLPVPIDGRVLVVDDNRDAAESLGELLRLLGAEADVVFDGRAALATLERRAHDAVLLDIDMPGMDGYEVAQQIRAREGLGALRLIAVTGWGQEEARQRALAAGFDHHLTKPISRKDLLALLSSLGT